MGHSPRRRARDTHRGRPVAMQNRSMMSLELQYLLKTTCKTRAAAVRASGGHGFRGHPAWGFLSAPTCRLI